MYYFSPQRKKIIPYPEHVSMFSSQVILNMTVLESSPPTMGTWNPFHPFKVFAMSPHGVYKGVKPMVCRLFSPELSLILFHPSIMVNLIAIAIFAFFLPVWSSSNLGRQEDDIPPITSIANNLESLFFCFFFELHRNVSAPTAKHGHSVASLSCDSLSGTCHCGTIFNFPRSTCTYTSFFRRFTLQAATWRVQL